MPACIAWRWARSIRWLWRLDWLLVWIHAYNQPQTSIPWAEPHLNVFDPHHPGTPVCWVHYHKWFTARFHPIIPQPFQHLHPLNGRSRCGRSQTQHCYTCSGSGDLFRKHHWVRILSSCQLCTQVLYPCWQTLVQRCVWSSQDHSTSHLPAQASNPGSWWGM